MLSPKLELRTLAGYKANKQADLKKIWQESLTHAYVTEVWAQWRTLVDTPTNVGYTKGG
jgi:hypothetical protein